ncbi:hypothetical protein RFI_34952, partial [Reticulomyxa filosa]
MDYLIESYVLFHKKSWMEAVQDVERILFQEPNFKYDFSFWDTDARNKNQLVLNFVLMSPITACFLLRYLMTFQRDELKEKFKNSPIKIVGGKSQYSKITRIGDWRGDYDSPHKRIIENELKKWKVPIQLKQDKTNPAIWCLNEADVLLFFQVVPPGQDCLK